MWQSETPVQCSTTLYGTTTSVLGIRKHWQTLATNAGGVHNLNQRSKQPWREFKHQSKILKPERETNNPGHHSKNPGRNSEHVDECSNTNTGIKKPGHAFEQRGWGFKNPDQNSTQQHAQHRTPRAEIQTPGPEFETRLRQSNKRWREFKTPRPNIEAPK